MVDSKSQLNTDYYNSVLGLKINCMVIKIVQIRNYAELYSVGITVLFLLYFSFCHCIFLIYFSYCSTAIRNFFNDCSCYNPPQKCLRLYEIQQKFTFPVHV